MRKDNTSGYIGVTFHKPSGKYQARAFKDRRQFYLGLFVDPRSAAEAVNDFARANGRVAPNDL